MKRLANQSMKNKVTFMLFSSVLLTCVVFVIALNIFVTSYIGNEATEAISKQIAVMNKMNDVEDYLQHYKTETKGNKSGFFTVNSFSVDNDFMFSFDDENIDEYNYYLSQDDRTIQKYFKENPSVYEDETIFSAKIEKQRYRLGTATITWDSMENGPKSEKLIFYINETPLYKVATLLNVLFLIILAICVIDAIYAGMKAGKMIENSQQKLKNFFAYASHELKTPLMSIQGYAEGIKTGVIEDTDMAMDIIIKQSDNMYALVEELLYLSKLGSGEFVFEKNRINIGMFIEDCFSSATGLATKCGVNISFDCPQKEITILGDENQLQKAFMNIISNAFRYAKENVSVNIVENAKNVEICIEDDGEGISEEDLPNIFERFYTGQKGNTGIGLSLTKEIITKHKGTIKAVNGNKGAKFIIALPTC